MWSLRDILSGIFWLTLPKRIPLLQFKRQGDSFFSEFSIYPFLKLLASLNWRALIYRQSEEENQDIAIIASQRA
jgi:hypothetical protein